MYVDTLEFEEGFQRSIALMKRCVSPHGFLASLNETDNYRRIWGRDGVIVGLAALMSGDDGLIEAFRQTLITLADHQGPHGEIPSNVDKTTGRVSYGGTTGRVDADLWFVIGCGEYCKRTGDSFFAQQMMPVIDKVIFLLGAWEFNNRGLLYIPATGDWSDEYVHNGYILYDQLLYLQALKTTHYVRREFSGEADDALLEKIRLLERIIERNFWFGSDEEALSDDIYHRVLFEKGRKAADRCAQRYWLPFFSPHGYGYRFDGLANVLVSLLGVASSDRRVSVNTYLEGNVVPADMKLIPAFYPVIKPVDKDWEDLKIIFSYNFKNNPFEFHNGGLWPMITGFYVADLVEHGERDSARQYLSAIIRANALPMDGQPWGFAEYLHGKDFTPGGNRHQCWSASAAVMGYCSLQGKKVFSINNSETALR